MMFGLARGGLAGFASIACATLGGLVFMKIGGAPQPYLAINATALALATGLILIAGRSRIEPIRRLPALAVVLSAILVLSATFVGPEVDGVHRWLRWGPLNVHAGMLVLPVFVVLLPRIEARAGFAAMAIAAIIVALQPDRASALALTVSAATIFSASPDRWRLLTTLAATVAFGFTYLSRDDLEAVRFVESVVPDAVAMHPLLGGALATLVVIAICAPRLSAKSLNSKAHASHLAWSGCLSGYFVASLIGPYPAPLIGYGASPIIGFAIGLAFLNGGANTSTSP